MKEFIAILILLVLITLLCLYLVIGAVWWNIDIVSKPTEEYIKSQYDSEFSAIRFRLQVKDILRRLEFLEENKVIFHRTFYESRKNQKYLNAQTGFPGQNLILLTPGWAARLHREFCTSKNYDGGGTMTDLFIYALAHETAHKRALNKSIFLFGKKRICAAWIREIYADLEGIKRSGLSVERVIECINAEILSKRSRNYGKQEEPRLRPHPTWEYRIACMRKGTLDKTMIDMICRDCGVSDVKFCDGMRKRYAGRQTAKQ